MNMVNHVHAFKDGRYTAPSRMNMWQISMANEDLLCRDFDEFELHQVDNLPPLLRRHVEIRMGTDRNPQIVRFSSTDDDKRNRSSVLDIVKGLVTALDMPVISRHRKRTAGYEEREKFSRPCT